MESLGAIFAKLREEAELSAAELTVLRAERLLPVQRAAILAALKARAAGAGERDVARAFSRELPYIPFDSELFRLAHWDREIPPKLIENLVADFATKTVSPETMAAWMMTVAIQGLSPSSLRRLTIAMLKSGKTFDYRTSSATQGFRLLRRYPTGALSEKVALLLPALLVASSPKVMTPFLVARSLGFTGGTWDKLATIPGFTFPTPGSDTERALLDCRIAMTVTHSGVNPADEAMYQLRSITGTVESHPLIISSIASKQLCFPVHRLLMDVRYGPGAFVASQDEAIQLAVGLESAIDSPGFSCSAALIPAFDIAGSTLGNRLELAEAIAILRGRRDSRFDFRALAYQELLAVDLFSKLMSAEFPEMDASRWAEHGIKVLRSGQAWNAFRKMLIAHGVSEVWVQNCEADPWSALGISTNYSDIVSEKTGSLFRIQQKELGEIVNSHLGNAVNVYAKNATLADGLVMFVRTGDSVERGRAICRVYGTCPPEIARLIRSCFAIGH